jgi:hypothetical protein
VRAARACSHLESGDPYAGSPRVISFFGRPKLFEFSNPSNCHILRPTNSALADIRNRTSETGTRRRVCGLFRNPILHPSHCQMRCALYGVFQLPEEPSRRSRAPRLSVGLNQSKFLMLPLNSGLANHQNLTNSSSADAAKAKDDES